MKFTSLHRLPATELSDRIWKGEITSRQATESMLDRIADLDGTLRSYQLVTRDLALEQAGRADEAVARGVRLGPLHGVPIAVKDLCFTRGIPTGAGTAVLQDWCPGFDATVVQRLRDAGTVLLGKLKMTEGAWGAYHPRIASPVNPWNADYWTGHSSSGSGVATAAGLCHVSVGSDTGGSIRYPAGANGLYGLKPTRDLVSLHGIFPMAPSLDHVGPIARSVRDIAAVLSVLAGEDPSDPACLPRPSADYLGRLEPPRGGAAIATLSGSARAEIHAEVRDALERAESTLAACGAKLHAVLGLEDFKEAARAWVLLAAPEIARAHSAYYEVHKKCYGRSLANLIEIGLQMQATEMAAALEVRRRVVGHLQALFGTYDFLLLPIQPMAPPRAEQIVKRSAEVDRSGPAMWFTAPFNLSGHPALAMPAGRNPQGLPIGVQLIGPHSAEQRLLDLGSAYEASLGGPWQGPPEPLLATSAPAHHRWT